MANRRRKLQEPLEKTIDALIVLATLPYYRFYDFNTRGPIENIARYKSNSTNFPALVSTLYRWRQRKLAELQYISIACAILLGAVIGTFSWNNVDTAYWLTRACWYLTLLLAVLGILLSAQQVTVLNFLGDIPDFDDDSAEEIVDRYMPLLISGARYLTNQPEAQCRKGYSGPCRPHRRMIFVWQCPIMFMSYAASLFLLGLTILVITPLIRLRENGWTGDATVAVIYLGGGVVLAAIFVFSAFWVYHYLDIDIDVALGRSTATQRTPGNAQHSKALNDIKFQVPRGPQNPNDSVPFGQYRAQSILTTGSMDGGGRQVKVRRRASMS